MSQFARDKGEEKKYSVLLCPEPEKALSKAPPPQGGMAGNRHKSSLKIEKRSL